MRARRALASAVAALTLLAAPTLPASAHADPEYPVTDAKSLLAAIQGGRLLGVPPLPDLARGAAQTHGSAEFWINWIRDLLERNRILLPLPVDVIKPDVFLPHAQIDSGQYTSPLPVRQVAIGGITYRWEGRKKTVSQFLRDTETDALLFVHNGHLVSELYANGWSPSQEHQAWSTTKSFVSTAVGVAVDRGLISSLDDPIERYVPQLAGTAWRGTTIRNILTMRSGIAWDEHTTELQRNDQVLEWIDLALDYYSGGRVGRTRNEFVSSLPRVRRQGEQFSYNSANTQVLAWLLESVYREPFNRVLSQTVWQPAGMEAPADIMTDRTGAAIASEALFARPRDFTRFGEVMRNGGRTSDGRRVVSAEWVTAATTGMTGPARDAGDTTDHRYGYQWWSGPTPDSFQANGFQGQYITVSPAHCVTGVRLAHTLTLSTSFDFAGQGNEEWQAVYRAVLSQLGVCAE